MVLLTTVNVAAQTEQPAGKSTKMAYWSEDKAKCPECDQFTIDGIRYTVFQTPDFDLVFTAVFNEKLIFAPIMLVNKSKDRIEFDPSRSVVALFKKQGDQTPVEYRALTPEEAAKRMRGNVEFRNFLLALSGAMAQNTYTVNSNSTGIITATNNRGGMATGVYNGQTNSTVTAPDVNAQRSARNQIEQNNQEAKQKEDFYLSSALRANTIFPQKEIAGNIYFEKGKGEFFWVGIFINNTLYLQGYTLPKK
jgi:hypothetical protein